MPKSIYTILFLCVVVWGTIFYLLFNYKPEGLIIYVLLLLLFVGVGFLVSFPIYFVFYKTAPSLSDLKILYRRSLKWGFFLSSGLTFVLWLRATGLFNIITALLFLVFYLVVFYQIKGSR